VSLAELRDRSKGKRFGETVHRIFEAFPPVSAPWPPPGMPLPSSLDGEEVRRWDAIAAAVRSCPLFRKLRGARVAGTELPLFRSRGGAVVEVRADLVVYLPGPAGEVWVVDYKTGERDRALEERYFFQLGEYRDILAEAWGVPVRAFLWYVETGESVEAPGMPPAAPGSSVPG
jgi:hypothetical protein